MNPRHSTKLLIAAGVTALLTGCFSNKYQVTYNSQPTGAQLYCNGKAKGYTPVDLYYELDEATKKRGHLYTQPCIAKWVSGAKAQASNKFDINKFPNGVMHTIPRPNVSGYTKDAEFALKVKAMRKQEEAAAAAHFQQSLQNLNNTMNNISNSLNTGSSSYNSYNPPKVNAPTYYHYNGKSLTGSDGSICHNVGNSVVCN